MLHQPQQNTKFHQNPLQHLLNLHSGSQSISTTNNNNNNNNSIIDKTLTTTTTNVNNLNNHQQSTLDAVNDQIGKSFTIAAILGLKKNVAAVAVAAAAAAASATHSENLNGINNGCSVGTNFNDVMNLSINHHHQHHQLIHSNGNSNNIGNGNNNNNNNGKFDFNRLGQHFHNSGLHNNSSSNNNTTNSALQSLQQLHQHHTNTSGFHAIRDRQRENTSKKAALKSKRVRTIFTPEQLERLEAEFERQQYMVGPERLYLAHTLQLTEAQVKVWFQNRRIKWRKHHLEITHQRLALLRQRQIPTNSLEHNLMSTPPTSEQDLTICSDSMDTGSIPDIGDDS